MKEREISLVDLLVEILLRWRVIVVFMLIGGILLGAFGFVRSVRSSRAQSAKAEELKSELGDEGLLEMDFNSDALNVAIDEWIAGNKVDFEGAFIEDEDDIEKDIDEVLLEGIHDWLRGEDVELLKMFRKWAEDDKITLEKAAWEWLNELLTDGQKNNMDYVLYYEELARSRKEYSEESIYMQIDPNNTVRGDITFLVSAAGTERTANIERVYEDLINGPEIQERLAEASGLPVAAVSDIYALARSSGGLLNGGDTFRVYFLHYDEKLCQKLMNAVIDFINEKHAELVGKLGEHEVTVAIQSLGKTGNAGVLSTQRNFDADVLSLENAYMSRKAAFSDPEWYYYNLLTEGKLAGNPAIDYEEEEEEEEEEENDINEVIDEKLGVTSPGISLKYIILGMIMAAFLYAFVIFMIYVLDGKLRATDQLQELYDIPQLGQIPGSRNSKKPFGFVDEWILSLRYHNQRKFTPQEALKLATVAVKMAAEKNELRTVCLMGCDLKEQTLKICEQIKASLGQEDIKVQILNNVIYDAEAMEKLGGIRGAVLVEKAGSTLYTEIAQELELLKRQEIMALGGVVVE